MCVTDFAAAYRFYTTRFNFASSDVVYDDTDTSGDMTTFLHLGRGDELVDHHCFFFEGPVRHVHHASYETYDVDTQPLGHDGLCSKGYEDCRGVRRHLMGSQIFDHWFDPSRFVLEHYVDGDLVNRQCKPHRSQASPDGLHIWGVHPPLLPLLFAVLFVDKLCRGTTRLL